MTFDPAVDAPSSAESSRAGTDAQLAAGRLLTRAREGSKTCLGELLEACRAYLLLVANDQVAHDVRQKVAPSDLVQETLHEAYRAFENYRGTSESELLAWLRRILINNVTDATRKFRYIAKRQVNREVSIDDQSGRELSSQLVCPQPSPSGQAVHSERRRRVLQAVEQLDARTRQVILWRNLEQLSFAEIGKRLEISEDGARKIWSRAVQRLALNLRERDGHSG